MKSNPRISIYSLIEVGVNESAFSEVAVYCDQSRSIHNSQAYLCIYLYMTQSLELQCIHSPFVSYDSQSSTIKTPQISQANLYAMPNQDRPRIETTDRETFTLSLTSSTCFLINISTHYCFEHMTSLSALLLLTESVQ